MFLTVASAPTNLKAVQKGPSEIKITWNNPISLEYTTGYQIHYKNGSNYIILNISSNSSHLTLMNLPSGKYYNISIVGVSNHFPSEQKSVRIFLGESFCSYYVCVKNISYSSHIDSSITRYTKSNCS